MLKRVISGLMAIALSLSLILCVPQASATGESEKRLVLIERFDESNQLDSEYVFSYKMDKLERIDGKLYNIDPEINKYTETVICNDGKLVSGISEVEYEWGTVTSGESYEYNVLGQLVSGKAWEGGMVEYTYTYDSSGKLSRRNAIVEGGTEEIKYIYDGQGRLQQEKVTFTYEDDEYGDGWSEVVNYQYDNQGRVLRATRIDDWGSESVEYDYSYASFVLVEDTYGESLCLYDEQGLVIFDLFVDNPMYVTDNGYIEKIVDTDSYTQEQTTWVFTYEETAIPQKPEVEITESEWIQLHKDYANSTLFKDQVTQEFHGALGTAIEDIKKDKLITSYNTLDSINKILGFDLDLSDVQEYELLLAQILFSRNGVESIENIYSEYLERNRRAWPRHRWSEGCRPAQYPRR